MRRPMELLTRYLKIRSFRVILTLSFMLISILPLSALQGISNASMRDSLQANMNQQSVLTIDQARNNLSLSMESYEDILYQLYTNDDLISYVDNIENGVDVALNTNQLNRILTQMTYAKDDIEAVTIITMSRATLLSDKLRGSYVISSWLDAYDRTPGEILACGMDDYRTKLLPTGLSTNATPVFHMVHRLIDHKHVEREIGVVALSINEAMLQRLNSVDNTNSFYFIVDGNGRIVSYPNKDRIGEVIAGYSPSNQPDATTQLTEFLLEDRSLTEHASVFASTPVDGWQVVGVIDQSGLYAERAKQERAFFIAGISIIFVTGMLIYLVSSLLARSMRRVEQAMQQAEAGDLKVRVDEDRVFSRELRTIASTYNAMILRIQDLLRDTREASGRQRKAEIKALEAQLNPHFLYNTLDSINWMAIDNEQYEISGMITALARILRYSIDNSNGIVPLREEVDWLNQYVHLQQMRYKNRFSFSLDVDDALLEYPIHKLLFQPFVENAIVHGFAEEKEGQALSVSIRDDAGARVVIRIQDNGRGMDATQVADGLAVERDGHIGMANACSRIRMYYGETTDVQVHSAPQQGTEVMIVLKRDEGGAPS